MIAEATFGLVTLEALEDSLEEEEEEEGFVTSSEGLFDASSEGLLEEVVVSEC
jgi:hypothetical protein